MQRDRAAGDIGLAVGMDGIVPALGGQAAAQNGDRAFRMNAVGTRLDADRRIKQRDGVLAGEGGSS